MFKVHFLFNHLKCITLSFRYLKKEVGFQIALKKSDSKIIPDLIPSFKEVQGKNLGLLDFTVTENQNIFNLVESCF